MRVLETGEDLAHDLDRALGRDGAVVEQIGERLALDVLHDEVRRAFVDAEVDQRDAVGMVEPRGGARLALEAIDDAGLVGQHCVQELDDDGAADPDALALVDHAHAALGQQRDDAIAALQDLAFARVNHGGSAGSVAEIYEMRASTTSGAMFFNAKPGLGEAALEARVGRFGPHRQDPARRTGRRACGPARLDRRADRRRAGWRRAALRRDRAGSRRTRRAARATGVRRRPRYRSLHAGSLAAPAVSGASGPRHQAATSWFSSTTVTRASAGNRSSAARSV